MGANLLIVRKIAELLAGEISERAFGNWVIGMLANSDEWEAGPDSDLINAIFSECIDMHDIETKSGYSIHVPSKERFEFFKQCLLHKTDYSLNVITKGKHTEYDLQTT